jgi:hypothetical protein
MYEGDVEDIACKRLNIHEYAMEEDTVQKRYHQPYITSKCDLQLRQSARRAWSVRSSSTSTEYSTAGEGIMDDGSSTALEWNTEHAGSPREPCGEP